MRFSTRCAAPKIVGIYISCEVGPITLQGRSNKQLDMLEDYVIVN